MTTKPKVNEDWRRFLEPDDNPYEGYPGHNGADPRVFDQTYHDPLTLGQLTKRCANLLAAGRDPDSKVCVTAGGTYHNVRGSSAQWVGLSLSAEGDPAIDGAWKLVNFLRALAKADIRRVRDARTVCEQAGDFLDQLGIRRD